MKKNSWSDGERHCAKICRSPIWTLVRKVWKVSTGEEGRREKTRGRKTRTECQTAGAEEK